MTSIHNFLSCIPEDTSKKLKSEDCSGCMIKYCKLSPGIANLLFFACWKTLLMSCSEEENGTKIAELAIKFQQKRCH